MLSMKSFSFFYILFLALLFSQKTNFAQVHYFSFHYEPIWTSVSRHSNDVDYFLPINLGISYSYKIFDRWGLSLRGGYIPPFQRYFGGLQYGVYLKHYWKYGLNILSGINNNLYTSGNHANSVSVNKKNFLYFVIGLGYMTGAFDIELQYLPPLAREIGYELINAPTIEGSHSPVYINAMIKVSIAYCIEL
ncbi:MAG: hypothetical protein CVV24_02005 [Ignavibacteriae bacterium HGW-Ignavibacteriae-3]|nr:MAG: hypothetical protein CVV24_02005 [Ignavibacteriae bacterium HGW-Ignavibacteriae-3]